MTFASTSEIVSLEGATAGQHLEHTTPNAQMSARLSAARPWLVRGHIGGRAENHAGLRHRREVIVGDIDCPCPEA
jgi:hypothetical protein